MAEDRLPRKLVAILHADVAGYSRLSGEDEDTTHRRLKESLTLISTTVDRHNGQVVNYAGDAVLARFDAAVDALACATAIQKVLKDRNSNVPDERKVEFRIGVNLGDVIEDQGDIYGDGVNVAARLERLAEPGGICISEAVHTAVGNKLSVGFADIGEQQVKNIEKPVRVYRVLLAAEAASKAVIQPRLRKGGSWRWFAVVSSVIVFVAVAGIVVWQQSWRSAVAPPAVEGIAHSLPDKPSIAVLPFTNMSGDPDQEYFADGITEDLTTDLSKLSGLFVVARNSSFTYRGKALDLREVSRELGVRYLLEGSVRRRGEQVRINAQLVDGVTGGHLWAERFDGAMSNIFQLQDDVNQSIVEALAVSLTLTEREQLDRVETVSSAAYDVLLRGLEQFHRSSRETTLEARTLFKQAIELDPNYARAYANVALTHASDVNFLWTDNKEESIRLGLEYAAKAIELDDRIPQIYFTRSALYLAQRKHDAAIEAARRIIEVHPNYADGYGMLAFALCFGGYLPEALEAIRKAKKIDPQFTYLDLALEARTLFLLKRYDEAVGIIEDSVSRNPAYDRTQLLLAAIYAQMGKLEDASWAVEEAMLIKPIISLEYERREAYYKNAEDLEHYISALRKAGVPDT